MTSERRRVLVVDDEPLLRDIVSEWLEFEGYAVLTAENGADALRLLEETPADLVVTDIRMPIMDGVELLKELKESDRYSPAVIFVSGFTDVTAREAFDLGVEAILAKPFSDTDLIAAVRRVLTSREERWRMPEGDTPPQQLQAAFAGVDSARISGQLAFGRGGFCLRTAAALKLQPVGFELSFAAESLRVAGQGMVRWIQPGEECAGVEITGLEEGCLGQGIRLTAGSGARCFIPAKADAS